MTSDPLLADQRIRHLLDLGRYADAVKLLAARLAIAPEDPGLHALAARAHLGLGDSTTALREASSTIGLEPDRAEGHLLRAAALLELDDAAAAADAATAAARLSPHDLEPRLALALALARLPSEHARARAIAEDATVEAPEDHDSWSTLGVVLHSHAPDEARAAYERALALDPADASTLYNLAALEAGVSPARAVEGFVRSLSIDPTQHDARLQVDRLTQRLPVLLTAVGVVSLVVVIIIVAMISGRAHLSLGRLAVVAGITLVPIALVALVVSVAPLRARVHVARTLAEWGRSQETTRERARSGRQEPAQLWVGLAFFLGLGVLVVASLVYGADGSPGTADVLSGAVMLGLLLLLSGRTAVMLWRLRTGGSITSERRPTEEE